MKNTLKIVGFSETCGDKFFKIEITDKEGLMHTDIFSEETLVEAAIRIKGNFEVDETNEELVHELSELAIIEVAEEEDDFTGKMEYDVYFHGFKVDEDVLEYDVAGKFLKTYKTKKGAMNFANKQGYTVKFS